MEVLQRYAVYINNCVEQIIAGMSFETEAAFNQGHQDKIFAVRPLPGGKYICTLGVCEAKVWDIETGRRVCELFKKHEDTDTRYPFCGAGVQHLPVDFDKWPEAGFSCSECWCARATYRKEIVALGRTDSSITFIAITSYQGYDMQCTFVKRVFHNSGEEKNILKTQSECPTFVMIPLLMFCFPLEEEL